MFQELEFKYKADSIKVSDFIKLMEPLQVKTYKEVSSPDVYYTKGDSEFLRFRKDSIHPELTKKVKVKDTNNWIRVEIDLPLDPKRLNDAVVKRFAQELGYQQNFKIHKICHIFFLEECNYVFYVVLDEELKEIGRFIEVEINKDKVQGMAEGALEKHAELLVSLGLSPKNRLKKSLFEMYRK